MASLVFPCQERGAADTPAPKAPSQPALPHWLDWFAWPIPARRVHTHCSALAQKPQKQRRALPWKQ